MERKNKKGGGDADEVEQMLRAAQDELLLKLSIDSHMSHLSPNLNSDLDRRFQALKSSSAIPPATDQALAGRNQQPKSNVNGDDDDDLFARFAALKASSSASAPAAAPPQLHGDSYDEEDEVEKIIRWAKDAARLDPSSPSDDDDDGDNYSTDSDAETDDSSSRTNKLPK